MDNKNKRISHEMQKKLDAVFDICEQFDSDFNRSAKYTKCYAEVMWGIFENEMVNDNGKMVYIRGRDHFCDVTGLGPSTYSRIKRCKEDYVPSLQTFMTLCVIYNLDIPMALILRESFGYGFNKRNRVHQAYCYLLVNCRGKSISYCNKVLKILNPNVKGNYLLGNGEIDEYALIEEVFS